MFRSHSRDIDLILLDVVMPKMNGFDAYREMCKTRAGVDCIFVTGYNSINTGSFPSGEDTLVVLEKPYSMEKLSQKIREVLDLEKNNNVPAE